MSFHAPSGPREEPPYQHNPRSSGKKERLCWSSEKKKTPNVHVLSFVDRVLGPSSSRGGTPTPRSTHSARASGSGSAALSGGGSAKKKRRVEEAPLSTPPPSSDLRLAPARQHQPGVDAAAGPMNTGGPLAWAGSCDGKNEFFLDSSISSQESFSSTTNPLDEARIETDGKQTGSQSFFEVSPISPVRGGGKRLLSVVDEETDSAPASTSDEVYLVAGRGGGADRVPETPCAPRVLESSFEGRPVDVGGRPVHVGVHPVEESWKEPAPKEKVYHYLYEDWPIPRHRM